MSLIFSPSWFFCSGTRRARVSSTYKATTHQGPGHLTTSSNYRRHRTSVSVGQVVNSAVIPSDEPKPLRDPPNLQEFKKSKYKESKRREIQGEKNQKALGFHLTSSSYIPSMNSPRASWDAVRHEVRAFRASLYPAAIPVTKEFAFDTRNGRVYFIGNDPARSIKNSVLFTANVPALGKGSQHDQEKEREQSSSKFSPTKFLSEHLEPALSFLRQEQDVQVVRWRPLLSEDWLKEKPTESLSREELFVKERRRLSLQGITTYEFCGISQRILFTTGNIIYLAFTSESIPFTPLRLDTTTPGARLDVKLGGLRRDLVAFVRNRNLWVTTHDGVETQLTHTNDSDDRTLGCGVVEFVMQEEFHRFTGYHWAPPKKDPNSTCINHEAEVERIVYLQVSENDVDIVHIPQSSASPLDVEAETVRNRDSRTADWEEYKYPRAGRPNATSDVQIVEFVPRRTNSGLPSATDKAFSVQKILWGPASLQNMFPWMEYIVRFGWLPNGYSIWVFILDRTQTRCAVLRIPLSNFLSRSEHEEHPRYEECIARVEVLYQETSKCWINITDIHHFFNDPGPESEEQTIFIWPSESTGFRHLYLISKHPRQNNFDIRPITHGSWPVLDKHIFVDTSLSLVYFSAKRDGPLESHFYVASYAPKNNMSIQRLTDLGYSHTIAMDDTRRWLLSTYSNIKEPPRTSVFELKWEVRHDTYSMSSPQRLGRVGPFGLFRSPKTKNSKGDDKESPGPLDCEHVDHCLYAHNFQNDIKDVFDGRASLNNQTTQNARHSTPDPAGTDGSLMDEMFLAINPVSGIMPNSLPTISSWEALANTEKNELPVPELFDFVNSEGTRIYGLLYKPEGCLPGRKYPTLLSIYGGPRSQIVTNDYKYPRFVRIFLAVRLGFGVVMIDGRGSTDRGLQFEGSIKGKLGTVELNDQIEGLRYLIHGTGGTDGGAMDNGREEKKGIGSFIDEKRIAITGWSYGGYLSLMALAQYPDVFKIAIAGAPVTQWELYDSAYTERYMGLPKDNPKGYQEGNVLTYIEGFPDSENRLLISHGLLDENVHFKHTEALVGALIKRNKPHRVQMYPTERHGLRLASVNEHFDTLMFYCCINYL